MIKKYKCELCERETTEITKHHLIPKEKGGKIITQQIYVGHAMPKFMPFLQIVNYPIGYIA